MKSNIIIIMLIMTALSFGVQFNAHALPANNINEAYQQYAAIDKALANDNTTAAKEAASQLISILNNLKDADAAIKAATGINEATNIKEQRRSFAALTVAMDNLFKKEKPGKMLYIHYCPMAKAFWMDEDKGIHNPYLGKSMPTCGKTTGMVM